MPKALLVNCYLNSTKTDGLLEALEQFSQCTLLPYREISQDYRIANDIDAVVISGSEARIVDPLQRAQFGEVLGLIKNCNLPLFGICFGHQLLGLAFGAKTGSLKNLVINRFENVRILQTDEIFDGFKEGQVVPLSEYHNDYVLKDELDSVGFALLADSASCEVEAIKHKTKPFYGVQFHPERVAIRGEVHPEGHKIIENFFKGVVRR
ncbi:MAG: gamma-glutamyl-gamma-aminobutyrate hydrolase family protein [Candidatus Bathyarchaeota archaeon]|nr:gamma-glutamyl-gamma-aminobutyrate hydrolase family protein [Candidatus Bathyarchaeota archaeon]